MLREGRGRHGHDHRLRGINYFRTCGRSPLRNNDCGGSVFLTPSAGEASTSRGGFGKDTGQPTRRGGANQRRRQKGFGRRSSPGIVPCSGIAHRFPTSGFNGLDLASDRFFFLHRSAFVPTSSQSSKSSVAAVWRMQNSRYSLTCAVRHRASAMARIYISSTVQDLREFRVEVYKAVRRLGHTSVTMEDWAASDVPPLKNSLRAVRDSDVNIVLVAWRYGYVPPGQNVSITELEVNAALEAGIPCLVFLVPDDAPWLPEYVDESTAQIRAFRRRLLEGFAVAWFRNPEELAHHVAVALHAWVAQGTSTVPAAPISIELAEAPPGPGSVRQLRARGCSNR